MRGSRKFRQRGPTLTFFFWWGERGSKKRAIIGPPAKRHLNGVSLAGRWWPNMKCWLCSFVIFQGIHTSIAKKPFTFVIFRGWGSDPLPPPSGSVHGRCPGWSESLRCALILLVLSCHVSKLLSVILFIWAATWAFHQCGMCDQQRLRPALHIRAVWSEPLLLAWILFES